MLVNGLDCLSISGSEHGFVDTNEISCEDRQNSWSIKELETGNQIVLVLSFGLFEERIDDACGLGFDHLDGQKRKFVLPIGSILLSRSN